MQGCGSTTFPPNARARWDYSNGNPVQSRCEHFGLGDGTAGADLMEPFTDDKIAAADQAFPDCGGGWQIYWRQSIPGFGNTAKTDRRPPHAQLVAAAVLLRSRAPVREVADRTRNRHPLAGRPGRGDQRGDGTGAERPAPPFTLDQSAGNG